MFYFTMIFLKNKCIFQVQHLYKGKLQITQITTGVKLHDRGN
uniref:Uncharacterized protein n=1 Tax=Anguilla anguilla TaxID=7936 RepID=A0A0E9UN26_ANGAN